MIGNALEWIGAAALVMLLTAFEVVAYFAPIVLQITHAILLWLIYQVLTAGKKKNTRPCPHCGQECRTPAGIAHHKRVKHPEEYAAEKTGQLKRSSR